MLMGMKHPKTKILLSLISGLNKTAVEFEYIWTIFKDDYRTAMQHGDRQEVERIKYFKERKAVRETLRQLKRLSFDFLYNRHKLIL